MVDHGAFLDAPVDQEILHDLDYCDRARMLHMHRAADICAAATYTLIVG